MTLLNSEEGISGREPSLEEVAEDTTKVGFLVEKTLHSHLRAEG